MTCASSSVKACSLVLLLLSCLIFFNWIYLTLGYQEDFYDVPGTAFEGLWGAAPLLVTGIIGLSTACGDTPCKRILLLVSSILAIPVLSFLFYPLALSLVFSTERYYSYYHNCLTTGYNGPDYAIESCLRDYANCVQHSASYSCANSFESCLRSGYHSNYNYDCGGLEMYSVIQIFLTVIALITDIVLIIVTAKHHKCCGPTCCESVPGPPLVPVVVPGSGYAAVQTGGTVYMVPQGSVFPPGHGAGVPMQAGQGYAQPVVASYYNQGMVGAGGPSYPPGGQPQSYSSMSMSAK